MNKLLTIVVGLLLINCQGQSQDRSENEKTECNQKVYGTQKYIQNLPPYICIPKNYIIDDYVRAADLERNGHINFLAIKYNKREDDQNDGDTTYWNFYKRTNADTMYTLTMRLSNIVPPFIKKTSNEYLVEHPLAAKLFKQFPRRLKSHALSFQIESDSLRLSYKFEDSYGKTFVFVYDKLNTNWRLERIDYFIGELPTYWWRDDEYYYPLNDKLKIIESRQPKEKVFINNLDLKLAFMYREEEWTHLAEWHIDNLNKGLSDSILKAKLQPCQGLDLPSGWVY
jgi:hypothetical protein